MKNKLKSKMNSRISKRINNKLNNKITNKNNNHKIMIILFKKLVMMKIMKTKINKMNKICKP